MKNHEQRLRAWVGAAFGAALLSGPALARTVEICNTTSNTVSYTLAAQSGMKGAVSTGWESLAASGCTRWSTDAEHLFVHAQGGSLLWDGASEFCMNTGNFVITDAGTGAACDKVGDYRTGFLEIPIIDDYVKYELGEANAANVAKSVEVCNRSAKNAYVTIAYYADRGPYLDAAGWGNVDVDECLTYSLPNTGKEFFVALDSTDMELGWRGDVPLCVDVENHFVYRGAAHRLCTGETQGTYNFVRVPVGEDGLAHFAATSENAINITGGEGEPTNRRIH